jgi:hypothetical protein
MKTRIEEKVIYNELPQLMMSTDTGNIYIITEAEGGYAKGSVVDLGEGNNINELGWFYADIPLKSLELFNGKVILEN